ncbi:MAG: hypothetical protein ACRDYA_13585 [Egibacteraceae bacterium]
MGAADRGVKKSVGDQSEAEVTHDQGQVDEEQHGWAPDAPGSGEAKERVIEANRKAFEAEHGTAEGSRGDATEDPNAPPEGVGESVGRRGEDVEGQEGLDPGRQDLGTKGPTERPYGTSTARASTGIDPQDPTDEDMPNVTTGDQGG